MVALGCKVNCEKGKCQKSRPGRRLDQVDLVNSEGFCVCVCVHAHTLQFEMRKRSKHEPIASGNCLVAQTPGSLAQLTLK